MKKYTLLFILFAMPAYAFVPPTAATIQVHDMEMIKQQKFRMEELNDYNDVQQEKERYKKRNEQPQTVIQKTFSKKSKFVEDNGEIKIQYSDTPQN